MNTRESLCNVTYESNRNNDGADIVGSNCFLRNLSCVLDVLRSCLGGFVFVILFALQPSDFVQGPQS